MDLSHTERIERLLAEGKAAEAAALHRQHVDDELARAARGPINLSDLLAAREAFHLHRLRHPLPPGA